MQAIRESKIKNKKLITLFKENCSDSTIGKEWTFHQLSPYIGKIKSSIANYLILNFTETDSLVYDPFCGAGTIPFEAWSLKRKIVANDLNSYAVLLTKAKLFPPNRLQNVLNDIEFYDGIVQKKKRKVDLRKVPKWVRSFFHNDTLKETIAWVETLKQHNSDFLLACILGILHHQRPGFLSFPSSHTVPYLRTKRFPIESNPSLYAYRNVKERLVKKVKRAFKRIPYLDKSVSRKVLNLDARMLDFGTSKIDSIITSPPYMRRLDYGRDNRLRLWFLGVPDIKELDSKVSPRELYFIEMMIACLKIWKKNLKPNGKCILFLGDSQIKSLKMSLPKAITKLATKTIGGYKVIFEHESIIPKKRRVRRNYQGNTSETILVLQKV